MNKQLPIYVSIIEDTEEDIKTIITALSKSNDIKVVGIYKNCESALSEIENNPPDVILLDIGLPGMSGIEGAKLIKEKLPQIDIIMLTVLFDDELIFQSLTSGATGYLLKKDNPEKILRGIKEVFEGGAPMSMEIARRIADHFNLIGILEKEEKKHFSQLTERQRDVLFKIREGKSNKQIADELFITVAAVRFHCKNIYKILHLDRKKIINHHSDLY